MNVKYFSNPYDINDIRTTIWYNIAEKQPIETIKEYKNMGY